MRFQIQRETLLKPLQAVIGVVEKRQTMPVLANLLLVAHDDGTVSFTGTDLQIELVARVQATVDSAGEVTVPARKLFDICRTLPEGAAITVELQGERVLVRAGRSRFQLATLPVEEFPGLEVKEGGESLMLSEHLLLGLIDRVAFAMAVQDVRFYLNGMLLDVREGTLRTVATDGHRLALCQVQLDGPAAELSDRQLLLPRKAVLELQRLLEGGETPVTLVLGRNQVRLERDDVVFTSNLIDGRFPDYQAVIPIGADQTVRVDRSALRDALTRTAILSNEKYRGVRFEVSPDQLRVLSHNAEQEEAVEDLAVQTQVQKLEISFNVVYVQEALAALRGNEVEICLRDGNSSCLIRDAEDDSARHVVMPMRM